MIFQHRNKGRQSSANIDQFKQLFPQTDELITDNMSQCEGFSPQFRTAGFSDEPNQLYASTEFSEPKPQQQEFFIDNKTERDDAVTG